MLVADILHSCANERVAEAAVASIGGTFAEAVRDAAKRSDIEAGLLVVTLVRRFAREAGERDWRQVTAATGKADHPVLCGLRVIVERMLDRIHPDHDALVPDAKPDREVAAGSLAFA